MRRIVQVPCQAVIAPLEVLEEDVAGVRGAAESNLQASHSWQTTSLVNCPALGQVQSCLGPGAVWSRRLGDIGTEREAGQRK